ncbi:uncharacterized protein LOC116029915 [Ipomoea triloba]|uniref:uncharacterized protein LOC116029915 n=1 Tax=Ipomoea triloba TaxID=35885 RepID=UPI00125E2556|nr:uncharacterized protein LOC116029915 [Ipomoea triloba]
MEKKNNSAVPIIGWYVAFASGLCITAMLLNLFTGKYFSLNATWLTLLAVATKLTGDLTTPMSPWDNNSKCSSTVFLTFAMGNSFTSLGSMNDTHILTNLTALSILVATVIVDLCIQLHTHVIDSTLSMEIIFEIILLFCMFITIVCSALALPAIKKRAESRYQKLAASDEKQCRHTVEELRLSITKYWVMAASGSPPSLMKRLVTFAFTCIICVCSSLISYLGAGDRYKYWGCYKESDYKGSVLGILGSQSIHVFPIPLIMIIFLIRTLGYKYKGNGIKISKEEFAIEPYWTEKLVEWRQSSILVGLGHTRDIRKFFHKIEGLVFTFCIRLQIMIVICCKFCYVLSFYFMLPLLLLVNPLGKLINYCTGKLSRKKKVSNDQREQEAVDHNCFVILLEGEKNFPERILREIINGMDKHVQRGKEHCSQSLLNLLNQSFFFSGVVASFSGVVAFDSYRVPSLLSGEPPNCWTLPIVTLTSIAIAIPNIANKHVDWLVNTITIGLRYASLIDALDEKCGLKNIKNASDFVWVGVELHRKWLDMDLERKTGEISSAKDIIQDLVDVSKGIVRKFNSKENRMIVENPLYWPANVLAANSMYRITRTILLYYGDGECHAEELFRKLICMIADILAACLTNLPNMIYTKCINSAIEDRLESVRDAAIMFGETEDILKCFEERNLSSVGPSQPLCIDEWRGWIEQQAATISSSSTRSNEASSVESNEHVVLQMQA